MKLDTSKRKRFRVSNKVKKVASNDRFRLSISRSTKNISAQIIDDSKNITLLSASSVEKDIKSGSKLNKTDTIEIRQAIPTNEYSLVDNFILSPNKNSVFLDIL